MNFHRRTRSRAMREPFGTAGLFVAIVALVCAMAGGAWAAKKYVITSTSQIKPSVLKSLQGNAGPAGANGGAGANGKDGANGVNGANGTNGANGADGEDGSPWTAGGTLPSQATETGVWSLGHIETTTDFPGAGGNPIDVSVSFPIPLASELGYPDAHFIQENGKEFVVRVDPDENVFEEEIVQPACPGTAEAPLADPGTLCVYTGESHNISFKNLLSELNGLPSESSFGNPGNGEPGASVAGSNMEIFATGPDVEAAGTWAVTAE